MLIYIIKKISSFLLILLLLSLASFSLIYYAADISFYKQLSFIDAYYSFYQHIISNNPELYQHLGHSFQGILKQILSPTFTLCLLAIFFSIIIGFPVGVLAGLTINNTVNHFIKAVCLILYACPIIWIAVLITSIPFFNWPYVKNINTALSIFDIALTPNIDHYGAIITLFKSLWIPAIILTIQPCIITIQLISQHVNSTSRQNFIKVARITESSSFRVLYRHLLPNAIPRAIPQLTYNVTTLLFSTMVIEILFNRPGIGTWVFTAFLQQNYFIIAIVILGCGTLISLLTLLSELLVAMIYPIQSRTLYE